MRGCITGSFFCRRLTAALSAPLFILERPLIPSRAASAYSSALVGSFLSGVRTSGRFVLMSSAYPPRLSENAAARLGAGGRGSHEPRELARDELRLALFDLGLGLRLRGHGLGRRDEPEPLRLELGLAPLALPLLTLVLRPAHADPPFACAVTRYRSAPRTWWACSRARRVVRRQHADEPLPRPHVRLLGPGAVGRRRLQRVQVAAGARQLLRRRRRELARTDPGH